MPTETARSLLGHWRKPAGAALTVAALASPAGASLATQDVMRQIGVRPVEPATAASDFEAPLLDGGRAALSDHAGRWVVLTFFATWCGPCRAEMPSLERLHQELGDRGLSVLGVSVDRRKDPLPAFLSQLGVTFPILWDETGRAGSLYRASSIPITYVIDPSGHVVGVSIGARDWSVTAPAFASLLEGGELPGESVYADAEGPVELPRTLTPPTADVAVASGNLRPGEPFDLTVRILWAGNFNEYLLHPPRCICPRA